MCSTVILGERPFCSLAYNYDYARGHGLVAVNPRGVRKRSVPPPGHQALDWRAAYGSVSFCSFALELPTCGMNERGLCVSLMWHDEGNLPWDPSMLRLNPLQWIQYVLDCHSSVDDVVDDLAQVQPRYDGVQLHFAMLDENGQCAFLEFLDGAPRVTRDPTFPALTNSTYQRCLDALTSGNQTEPSDSVSSMGRFATLYRKRIPNVAETVDPLVAFELLRSVAQPGHDNQTRTVWSIFFEPKQRRVLYRTEKHAELRELRLSELELNEGDRHRSVDVHFGGPGSVADELQDYRRDDNLRILRLSESLSPQEQEHVADVVEAMYQGR